MDIGTLSMMGGKKRSKSPKRKRSRPRCRAIRNGKCVNKFSRKEEKLLKNLRAEYKRWKKTRKNKSKKLKGG